MGTNTGIGVGISIPFRNRDSGGTVLPPELKEALCGVWIADQNTNESPTRNIIKNKLKDRGGDFEILNAAYNGNSGYGKYDYDYTTWKYNKALVNILSNKKVEYFAVVGAVGFYTMQTNTYVGKIKITGLTESIELGEVDRFQIYGSDGTPFVTKTDGIFDINVTFGTDVVYMYVIPKENYSGNLDSPIYIEQVPEYQGAFCTDGVDDLIVSQKPVNEMLGGSNELTVVSMIHQIAPRNSSNGAINNQIRPNNTFIRNSVATSGKMGIYGYAISKVNDPLYNNKVVSNILGDNNDYTFNSTVDAKIDGKFSVEGYQNNNNNIDEVSQIAWYWTLIAKRVLTTDEINQVIAYYNLDKYVAPDIYYDVKKQGITNENHAEFGDKLIDYSGNGKDMQLYNFGWKLDSGVGKYEEDFTYLHKANPKVILTENVIYTPISLLNIAMISYDNMTRDFESCVVKVTGLIRGRIIYYYRNEDGKEQQFHIVEDGIYTIPKSYKTETGTGLGMGFVMSSDGIVADSGLTITQLPSYENALVFDGVDDYGQYVGDLGLKDYTVVVDRAYVELIDRQVPFVSNDKIGVGNTPFLLEYGVDPKLEINPYSYGSASSIHKSIDVNRKIIYQSAYVYNGNTIVKGASTNTGDGLTFGRYGGNVQYTALCLYNFMLFPYSLSEFLIERQLKKRKLGTLHPETNNND